MTRKHFKELAEALKAARPDAPEGSMQYAIQYSQWLRCVMEVRNVCSASNQKFSSARFLDACEV